MAYLGIIISIAFLVGANLLLKKGALSLNGFDLSLSNILKIAVEVFKNLYLLLGLLSYAIGFFMWVFVLSKINLSIAYPIVTSFSIILISVFSLLIFRESLSISQILGIFAIILGIFLLVLK